MASPNDCQSRLITAANSAGVVDIGSAPILTMAALVAGSAIDLTIDRLMESMVQGQRLAEAQKLLARVEKDFQNARLTSITKWNQTFLKMATAKREEAITALEAKDYRLARQLARESINVKPEIVGDAIRALATGTRKPIVVYPNSGEVWDANRRCWDGTATRFTAHINEWLDAGASWIGGCCRTTPADFRILREAADSTRRT